MTIRAAMTLLCAGGLMIAGCSGDGGAAATCGKGQPCDSDGGDGGDGGAPATCGKVQPCGGEVMGDWTFVETCQSSARFAASAASFSTMAASTWCPIQTLVGADPLVSGSLVFDAAGTYSLALVYGGSIDINFPPSCLAGLSCADTTAGLQSQIDAGAFPMPNVKSIACTGTSSCLCRAAVNRPVSESGTYSVLDNVLTFAATGGAVTRKGYCVEGNALHILEASLGSTGQTDIDSDLVAMRP